MSTLTFMAEDGGNIGYFKDTGAPVEIETNLGLLDETQMRRRLLCDIIKDAVTKTPLTTEHCKQIIGAIYCNSNIVREPNVDLPPSPFNQTEIAIWLHSDHRTLLAQLEYILDNDLNIKARTTELINQPKLSTVGSNTKISDAVHVFWESGFGSESIMRSTTYATIRTPAALMDPLNKEATTVYFPPAHLNIVFDKTFTKRLGFPDTKWDCISGLVSIQYTQLSGSDPVILEQEFSETTTKEDVQAGKFADYIKGNKEKNEAIATNAANLMEIIKIVETKELGDVAQVWLYLAYLVEKKLLAQRETALMITTDSVVYLFCQLLNLSCAYTGSRAKVESKKCSIYHYIAGEPDYGLKIKNMVQIAYDIAAQKILTQKFILAHVIADPVLDFRYMARSRTGTLVKKPGRTDDNTGRAITDTDRIKYIIDFFKSAHYELYTKQQGLLEIKNKFDEHIVEVANKPENDTDVNARFAAFNAAILPYKCEIYFTKVKGEYKGFDYILQDKFRDILYPNWMTATTGGGLLGGSSIDKVNYMTNETSSSISKEKNYVGGIRNDINDEITFLEATILTCSYLKLLVENNLTKSIEDKFDENEISLFAMTYDNLAYNINDTQYEELYQKIFNQPLTVVNPSTKTPQQIMLNDENILVIGVVLSKYLYFAKELSDEDRQVLDIMGALARARAIRSVPIPIFQPDTSCEGRFDVITSEKIQPGTGTGMSIFKKCYSGHTIIKWLIYIAPGLDFSTIFLHLFQQLYNKAFPGQGNQLLEYLKRDPAYQEEFIRYLINIFAFMFHHYSTLYVEIQNVIGQGIDLSMFTPNIPFAVIVKVNEITRIPFIMFYTNITDTTGRRILHFGGSNKYLLKKIKSKKNRVKKIKSKKNRAKKIKSKQHRLKKIKSKKFTRKNKKSKNGVI